MAGGYRGEVGGSGGGGSTAAAEARRCGSVIGQPGLDPRRAVSDSKGKKKAGVRKRTGLVLVAEVGERGWSTMAHGGATAARVRLGIAPPL